MDATGSPNESSFRIDPRRILIQLSRRNWIHRATWLTAGLRLAALGLFDEQFACALLDPASPAHGFQAAGGTSAPALLQSHASLLDEVQRAAFLFFWEQANPTTGLVKDRSKAEGSDPRTTASIAATGYGLTALCIADRRGWQDPAKIRQRVRNTLQFALTRLTHQHGFFYHFLDMNTGDRVFRCEVSTIDSAMFFCGALACRAYFEDAEIRELATKLYERADWTWFLQGTRTVCMGWNPEEGFLKARWDAYSELMMIYLLGLGSPAHPLPADTWDAWKRPQFDYYGMKFIGSDAPLFVHQFSHAWFDFRGKRDAYANYFENSIIATKVHKLWCLELAKKFPDYSEDLWGVSASDSANGYQAWGGPPPMGKLDGSIVPCAAGGALPFLPADTLRVLQTIRQKYERQAWRKYGFVDAFNPLKNWSNPDVIGIDVGITLLMAENARTGFVWEQFMKNEDAVRGMQRAGFKAEIAASGRPR